jgi:hypothetical protein
VNTSPTRQKQVRNAGDRFRKRSHDRCLETLLAVSQSDLAAYWSYVRRSCAAELSPLTIQRWLLLTDDTVERHWTAFQCHQQANRPRCRRDVADDRTAAWARRSGPRRKEDTLFADCLANSLSIGELRPDGTVQSVRPQAAPRGGGILISRLCRECRTVLPMARFSKKRTGCRSVCKACDNRRRRKEKA